MLFKKSLRKVHDLVDSGSKNVQTLVTKAEGFVDQAEELIKSSDNSIKIIAGFMIVALGMQTIASYTQLRVNVKMLHMMRGVKK